MFSLFSWLIFSLLCFWTSSIKQQIILVTLTSCLILWSLPTSPAWWFSPPSTSLFIAAFLLQDQVWSMLTFGCFSTFAFPSSLSFFIPLSIIKDLRLTKLLHLLKREMQKLESFNLIHQRKLNSVYSLESMLWQLLAWFLSSFTGYMDSYFFMIESLILLTICLSIYFIYFHPFFLLKMNYLIYIWCNYALLDQ